MLLLATLAMQQLNIISVNFDSHMVSTHFFNLTQNAKKTLIMQRMPMLANYVDLHYRILSDSLKFNKSYTYMVKGEVKSVYEPSGPSGRSLSRFP